MCAANGRRNFMKYAMFDDVEKYDRISFQLNTKMGKIYYELRMKMNVAGRNR